MRRPAEWIGWNILRPRAVAAVTATVRGVGACANGGDLLRAAALYSDAGFREDFANIGQTPELLAALATPDPLPVGERFALVAVRDVVELADGRVGSVVITASRAEGETADYLFFLEEAGAYVIDSALDLDAPPAGTPTP